MKKRTVVLLWVFQLIFACGCFGGLAWFAYGPTAIKPSSDLATISVAGAAPLAMDFMDRHPELTGIVVVVIDNNGGGGSLSLARESRMTTKQLYEQTISEARNKLAHPETTTTVMDHMPRPGESGSREEHAL